VILSEKLKIKDKGHVGMDITPMRVSKSAVSQTALMGQKTISFGSDDDNDDESNGE
jgi:hypothetical protein